VDARLAGQTIPSLFWERCRRTPERVAFRYKRYGIHNPVTWRAYGERVREVASGLRALGIGSGDRVAIVGDPCPEWCYTDLAALSLGAVTYGIYATCSSSQFHYMLDNGGAAVVVAENQEHVDKVLPLVERLPALRRVVVVDTRAMFQYRDPRLMTFDELVATGRTRAAEDAVALAAAVAAGQPEDVAFLVYTSGTSGPPKPAMISHRNCLTGIVGAFGEIFPDLGRSAHRTVSYLSMAHILERTLTIYLPLVYDVVPHLPESVEELGAMLFEVQPTFVYGVPRVWEKLASRVLVGVQSSSPVKALAYQWAMRIGRRYRTARWEGRPASPILALAYRAAHHAVFRHIRRRLGLARTRYALSTGAPLPPEVQVLWQIWGVDLVNLYGSTEAGGVITSQRPGYPRPGDVGMPASANAVCLAPDGEVLVRGTGVFRGYWRDEQSTAEAFADGWLRVGEIGELDAAGRLRLVDRKRDIMVTAAGKNLAPTNIENALKASPYISEAVVVADGRPYPTALIEIDADTVAEWARAQGIAYSDFASLVSHPRVVELIAREVDRANEQLARVEQVKKFRLLPRELDPENEDDPLTPTRKVKRKLMVETFADLVESMYREEAPAMRATSPLRILALMLALSLAVPPAAPAAEPYRVGVSAAITGGASTTYAPMVENFKAYIARVNAAGGVNGHPVEVLYEDDRAEPARAATNARKLADQDRVLLMVNTTTSATYKPMIATARESGVPLLFGGGVCPEEVFPPADPLLFCSTSFAAKLDGDFAVRFIHEQSGGKAKLGLVAMDIPVSRLGIDTAETVARQLGLEVTWKAVVPANVVDYTPFVARLKDTGSTWVFAWAPWPWQIGPYEALMKLGWQGQFLLWGFQPFESTLERLRKENLFGLVGTSLLAGGGPEIQAVQAEAKKHGVTRIDLEGWVAAAAVVESLKACRWPCDRQKLAEAMSSVSVSLPGIKGGPIRWTRDNHFRTDQFYRIYRWDGGKNAPVLVKDWTRVDVAQKIKELK
jgi:long-chain acyl-CoA synthetase